MKKFIAVVIVFVATHALMAETETVSGIMWTYSVSGDGAMIDNNRSSSISSSTTGDLTIPSILGGYPVTSIGDLAFFGCNGLTSVTIPDSVTSIGWDAFAYCSNLDRVFVPRALESLITQNSVFDGSFANVYYYDGDAMVFATVTLDAGDGAVSVAAVQAVPGYAIGTLPTPFRSGYDFVGWFTAAEGGDGVAADTVVTGDMTVYAQWEAINYTYNYTDNFGEKGTITLSHDDSHGYWVENAISPVPVGEFTVPSEIDGKRVTRIGDWYFSYCFEMTGVTIPEGITCIKNDAFYWCIGLASVTLPESLQDIYDMAFGYCTALREIRIPARVTYISDDAFRGCVNLTVTAPSTLRGMFTVPEGCTIEYYEVPQYTVTLYANGGTIDGEATYEETVFEGRPLGEMPLPHRTDYDFAGWFDETGKRVINSDNGYLHYAYSDLAVTGDMTLTARWIEVSPWRSYYDGDGHAVIFGAKNASVVTNGVLSIPATLTLLNDDGEEASVPVVGVEDSFNAYVDHFFLLDFDTLVIPANIAWIDDNAFQSCGSLTNVIFEGGRDAVDMRVEDAVQCAAEKVKEMFEATSDLGDWDGSAKLLPTVKVDGDASNPDRGGGQDAVMRFKVVPGDGTAPQAFLRVKVR